MYRLEMETMQIQQGLPCCVEVLKKFLSFLTYQHIIICGCSFLQIIQIIIKDLEQITLRLI